MNNKSKTSLGIFLLLTFLFIEFSVENNTVALQRFDQYFINLLGRSVSNTNTELFKIVSLFGSPLFAIGATMIICLWLIAHNDFFKAFWIISIQLSGSTVVEIIKQMVARSRPFHQLVVDRGYSFPSGHTFCTTILILTIFFLVIPKIGDEEFQLIVVLLGIAWIGVVATSRVYLGNHFASDVFASLFLASGYWCIVAPYEKKVVRMIRPLRSKRN